MKNQLLKKLALKAKNRLIHNTTKDTLDKDMRIKIITNDDDIFYDKVKTLLESNCDLTNPIKALMDETKMLHMSSGEKEKYLLETIDRYTKFRNRLEDEKALKFVY